VVVKETFEVVVVAVVAVVEDPGVSDLMRFLRFGSCMDLSG